MLVHGFLGGGAQWDNQVSDFSDKFQVVAPDLPGFGRDNGSPAPNRIEEYARAVLGQLDELEIEYFHLLGHSMGGMIVQEMIKMAPHRVDKLILYGTGSLGVLPGRFETISESKRRAIEDGPELTARRIAATWFMNNDQAEQYSVCANLGIKASPQAILAGLSAMEAWSGVEALPEIRSPTLVLWGDGDRTYPWSQTGNLWQSIAGSQLAVVPGCAHMVHLEKPAIFNALIEDFLASR